MRRATILWSLSLTSFCSADQAVIIASRDATLYQSARGDIANGSGWYSFSGLNFGGTERRALFYFDIAAAVPDGARITSVELVLSVSRSFAGPDLVYLHRTRADWGEGASDAGDPGGQGTAAMVGDATWIHRFYPSQRWAVAGGEFDPVASGSTPVDFAGIYRWPSTNAMVTDVQSWLDVPATNFGWTVTSPGSGSRSARRFDTHENPNVALRPRLIVTFKPPCPADYNRDGGVDGADVESFFFDWEAGRPAADVNADGGVDGGDVDTFFAAWEAGGC